MTEKVELVVDAKADLGEGSIWDSKDQKLIWIDIEPGYVHFYDPKSNTNSTVEVGQKVGTVVRRGDDSGNLVLGVHHGFAHFEPATQKLTIINDPESSRPNSRFNDGKCDPAGRFWAGTYEMTGDEEGTPVCGLYRLDVDGSVHQMLDGISCSNGLVWTRDKSTMYYIDTPTQKIDAFDYNLETGTIENRRPVFNSSPDLGYPDGMTIDADDRLWVAFWGGACVRCIDPTSGSILNIIELPTSNVTSCAFGGSNLDELYITTASILLDEEQRKNQPSAGGLFRCQPGVKGVQAFEYAG